MALATQCPHCQTTFRVANDQLKLRSGLVRCGSCREIFNGIEQLVRPELATPVVALANPVVANPVVVEHVDIEPVAAVPAPIPAPEPAPEPAAQTNTAVVVATDQPLPADTISTPRHATADKVATPSTASDRVAAAIDSFEEDLRIAEQTSQLAAADVHHTPFGLIKASTSETEIDAELDPNASAVSAPNVWHRHVGDEPNNQMAPMTLMYVAGQDDDRFATKAGAKDYDATARHDDDELDRIIDELQRKPWRGEKSVASAANDSDNTESRGKRKNREKATELEQPVADEPDFVLSARRQQRIGGRLRWAMWIIGTLLLIGLIGQSTYFFRDQLAARMPQLKPLLSSACAKIGCNIGLPMKLDTISFEANELQALDPARNLFSLNLLLRNHSDTVQAWPNIELTLNDANEKPIVRRVFSPHDYLSAATNPGLGFASDQEQTVKVTFELLQLKASGYRVYLYYP